MSKESEMKTAIVRGTRRVDLDSGHAHRRQVALVVRSLIALPDRPSSWDERTRTSSEVRAA
jgi:hypothetical protein